MSNELAPFIFSLNTRSQRIEGGFVSTWRWSSASGSSVLGGWWTLEGAVLAFDICLSRFKKLMWANHGLQTKRQKSAPLCRENRGSRLQRKNLDFLFFYKELSMASYVNERVRPFYGCECFLALLPWKLSSSTWYRELIGFSGFYHMDLFLPSLLFPTIFYQQKLFIQLCDRWYMKQTNKKRR